MRITKTLLATLLTTAIVLAGCGSGDTETSAQASSGDTETSAQASSGDTETSAQAGDVQAETPAQADDEQSEVSAQADGGETIVLKCGVKQSHSPYSYLDDNGELVGLDEDVVAEVFNRLDGYEVEFVGFAESPSIFAALQAGSIDFTSGQYVANAERRALYKFPTQCYNLAPMYLVSREENSFQTLEDIAGETLAMVSTSYQKETIGAYNKTHPGQEINVVDTSGDISSADEMQQIQTGQRNVALIFKGSFDTIQEELNIPGIVLSDEPVVVNDVYQVFSQDIDDEFIEQFDQILKDMLADGTLGRISEKWTGEDVISLYNDLVIPIE